MPGPCDTARVIKERDVRAAQTMVHRGRDATRNPCANRINYLWRAKKKVSTTARRARRPFHAIHTMAVVWVIVTYYNEACDSPSFMLRRLVVLL